MVDIATFCGNCGNASSGTEDRYCRTCGSPLDLSATAGTPETPTEASTLTARQQSTNGFAVAALVLGILWLYWLGSILALVFGYAARKQIDKSNGEQKGRGLATAGIVLGWIGVGLALLGIVAGIVVFAVGNTTTGSKASACSVEKSTISTALEAYKAATGSYPDSIGLLDGVGQTPPADIGVLLKAPPPDYTIDGFGDVIAIPNNPGGCT
jgi:Domain of unknown function (DUF4190)